MATFLSSVHLIFLIIFLCKSYKAVEKKTNDEIYRKVIVQNKEEQHVSLKSNDNQKTGKNMNEEPVGEKLLKNDFVKLDQEKQLQQHGHSGTTPPNIPSTTTMVSPPTTEPDDEPPVKIGIGSGSFAAMIGIGK